MSKKNYTAKDVKASGPYSHAVETDGYVFFSGQTAMNTIEKGAEGLKENIKEQTKKVFFNLNSVMETAGVTREDVVKVNVYLTTMDYFNDMNEIYADFFHEPYPARTCVAINELPLGAKVEIEMIAKNNK